MKTNLHSFTFLLLFILQLLTAQGQDKTPNLKKGSTLGLYLHSATGDLRIYGTNEPAPDTFQVYFSVPIPYREQSPIWLDIDCPEMISYRFIHLDSANIFVSALLKNSPDTTHLKWTSYVLIKYNSYSDLPDFVPLPDTSEYPEEVKKYLMPTACCQSDDPFIQGIATELMDTNTNLRKVAKNITFHCKNLNSSFPVDPFSLDAYYALKWGGTCISKAHAATALFRANHIPARNLEVIPLMSSFDMHWIIEYFVPDYGWVKIETTYGKEPYFSQHMAMVTFACNPEDEFPMFYPDNIESYWFASDSKHFGPHWSRAHSGRNLKVLSDSTNKVNSLIALTDSVYHYYTWFQGIKLNSQQTEMVQTAKQYQYEALEQALSKELDSTNYYLNQALITYRNTFLLPFQTIFYDDFENGNNGWSHSGINDDWELGAPSSPGPPKAYSGNSCWGINLSGNYQNNTNCYLESPPVSVNNLSCAFLSVKIWNDVEDSLQQCLPKDPLALEISTDDGATFSSLTRGFGGGIDYNTGVPRVPGWSRLTLDLSPFTGNTVIIRFHFTSNNTKTRPGSYIDNFRVYGRYFSADNVFENKSNNSAFNLYPNPANDWINIEVLNRSNLPATCSFFSLSGQLVLEKRLNNNKTQLNIKSLPQGVYLLSIRNKQGVSTKRFIKK